jgi:AraC-like DNA-binding protein
MPQKNSSWKLECSFLPDLDDLRLVHLKEVDHYYPPHIHEEFCITMILRGTEAHICRGERHVAQAGNLLCVNAEEAHASESIGAEYKAIQLKPRFIERLLFGGDHRLHFPVSIVRNPELFRMFVDLFSKLEERGSQAEKESELVAAIEMLLRVQSVDPAPTAEPRSVEKVRRYLRSHYSESISLSGLAEIVDLSPFHLVRVFRNQVGVPPHEYQTQVRVANAQRMLLDGRSIAEAAIETGFFDQSHLTRNFKRITGFTPGDYVAHSNIVQDS